MKEMTSSYTEHLNTCLKEVENHTPLVGDSHVTFGPCHVIPGGVLCLEYNSAWPVEGMQFASSSLSVWDTGEGVKV